MPKNTNTSFDYIKAQEESILDKSSTFDISVTSITVVSKHITIF